jgi:predicted RNA-binding protein YlxR (DUF448 family)
MTDDAATPVRTCVGCRRAVSQATLVRLVLDGAGRIVVDEARREPGRGAWVHRDTGCVTGAVKGGLARSFRRKVDPKALVNWVSNIPGSGDPGGVESTLATANEKS